MKVKKVYIGFAVDMDRAYSDYNSHGQLIPKTHTDYNKIQNHKNNFVTYTTKLLDYFKEKKYSKSVTWFVNEAAYNISEHFKTILTRCSKEGELGLHTHLNDKFRFNGEPHTMSNNKNDWEKEGIINANSRINNFLNYKNYIYKAGNHIRSELLFDVLADNLFSIDTTMDINNKNFENGKLFYDDTNISLGDEPFFFKCKNGGIILEIPEIRAGKALEHINMCNKKDNLCFINLQIHHWQYDQLIPVFDKLINEIKRLDYQAEFVDLRTMQKIFFKKKLLLLEYKIQRQIRASISDDIYYMSLKKCISSDFLELSIWLFNNYDKRNKIIELFAGIGQCSLYLHNIGFTALTICDFDEKRCLFHKNINTNNYITPLVRDFYDVDLNMYDICFFGNSINSSLCDRLDIQVRKYQDFINKNKTLIIHEKYGSGIKEFKYLLNNLTNYTIIKQIGSYYILKKQNISKQMTPFSHQFKTYNTIAFANIEHSIINDQYNDIIKLEFADDIMKNAGIFFPVYNISNNLQEIIHKCKLVFDIKIETPNKNSKIKIYTGIKWIPIDTELTDNFQTIELIDDFNFFKPSTYRIGFSDIENNIVYLKNISININE